MANKKYIRLSETINHLYTFTKEKRQDNAISYQYGLGMLSQIHNIYKINQALSRSDKSDDGKYEYISDIIRKRHNAYTSGYIECNDDYSNGNFYILKALISKI